MCATCAWLTVWPSGSWHIALSGLLHQICFWSSCRKLQCALQRCLYEAPGLTLGEFLFWCNFCCWWTLRSSIQTLFLMTRLGRKVSELLSEHPENFSVFWTSRWGDFLGFGHDCAAWISDLSQKKHRVDSLLMAHRRNIDELFDLRTPAGMSTVSARVEMGNVEISVVSCIFMYFHQVVSTHFPLRITIKTSMTLPWHDPIILRLQMKNDHVCLRHPDHGQRLDPRCNVPTNCHNFSERLRFACRACYVNAGTMVGSLGVLGFHDVFFLHSRFAGPARWQLRPKSSSNCWKLTSGSLSDSEGCADFQLQWWTSWFRGWFRIGIFGIFRYYDFLCKVSEPDPAWHIPAW